MISYPMRRLRRNLCARLESIRPDGLRFRGRGGGTLNGGFFGRGGADAPVVVVPLFAFILAGGERNQGNESKAREKE